MKVIVLIPGIYCVNINFIEKFEFFYNRFQELSTMTFIMSSNWIFSQ